MITTNGYTKNYWAVHDEGVLLGTFRHFKGTKTEKYPVQAFDRAGLLVATIWPKEVGSLRDTGTFIERWNGTEWQKIGPGLWISNIGDVTTSPVTLDLNDDVVLVDATIGNITINLPTAASAKAKVYIVKKINSSNTVTIDPDGSETIDGASTASLTSQNTSREFYSDGTEWWIR